MTYFPDIYSGVESISVNTILMIIDDKQMTNYGGLNIKGDIIIKGTLILK